MYSNPFIESNEYLTKSGYILYNMYTMIIHVTEFRKQLFQTLKRADAGEDITIIKNDTNKKYNLVPVKETPGKDIVKIARRMGKIGITTMSLQEMKKIFERRHDD